MNTYKFTFVAILKQPAANHQAFNKLKIILNKIIEQDHFGDSDVNALYLFC
jgi:hypothetical protein